MKTKELSKQVGDKVVEKYRSGLGYKKISKTLNIQRSTIKSIIKKWKEHGTKTSLPREGRPPKLMDQARRALIREAKKRPKITLKELQRFTAEIGVSVHRKTLSRTLHRVGLYGRVARKKSHCLKKQISKHVLCLPKGMRETPQTYGRRYSGQMRLKLSFLAIKENVMSGANPPPLITPKIPSPQWCMVVAESGCVDVFHRQGLGNLSELKELWMALNTGKSLRETCFSLPEI